MSEKKEWFEGTLQEIEAHNLELAAQQDDKPADDKPIDDKPTDDKPTDDKPADDKPADKPVEFDKKKFYSEIFEQDFEDDEKVKEYHRSLKDKATKYDTVAPEYEKVKGENELLKGNLDPLKYFPGKTPEEKTKYFVAAQLQIKYPDYDPNVLMRVVTDDIDKINPVEVLALNELLNDPKHEVYDTDEDAYAEIERKFGLVADTPFAEQDRAVQIAVKAAVKEAKNGFNKLAKEIEAPKPIDLVGDQTKKQADAKAQYDKILNLAAPDIAKIRDGLDKLDIEIPELDDKGKETGKNTTVFSYDMGTFKDSAEVKTLLAQVLDNVSSKESDWTAKRAKEVQNEVLELLKARYYQKNQVKIETAKRNAYFKEWSDKKFKEENPNRPDLNPGRTNPEGTKEQQEKAKRSSDFGKEMGTTGRKYKT